MEMRVDAERAKTLTSQLGQVLQRIEAAQPSARPVRLIAVSKLKPANDIFALHGAPHAHVHFGENYQQELLQKSRILPADIRWHFIGALQTNKCRPLAEQIPNLWCVESVDTAKKADELDRGRAACLRALRTSGADHQSTPTRSQPTSPDHQSQPQHHQSTPTRLQPTPLDQQSTPQNSSDLAAKDLLRVCVQVNTSGEAEKSGVDPDQTTALCRHILENCPHLQLQGLMTIGAIARSQATNQGQDNEDFVALRSVRDRVQRELGLDTLELSMGMSEDFENAIRCGSDEVRVGSTIFGQRPSRQEAVLCT